MTKRGSLKYPDEHLTSMHHIEHIEIIEELKQVDKEQWDLMNTQQQPFLSYAFLSGLEENGCVCEKTGWLPQHILIYSDSKKNKLIAAMPCYLKNHSYGEYIFDWSWADAYQRAGMHYYPKLSCATPFTPATTPKWLIHPEHREVESETYLAAKLISILKNHAKSIQVSSIHALFTNKKANALFEQQNFIQRSSSQFHWFNQTKDNNDDLRHENQFFDTFEDYLQTMSSRKRKNIKRERKSVVEQGVRFQWYTGEKLDDNIANIIFAFYLSTVYRYGAQQYLSKEFFHHFVKTIPNMTHVLIAYIDDSPVAGSLFFSSNSTLYGRYWGANEDIKDLHFETCYYQPIEYAIQHKLSSFEAGAQGEHKLSRGLLPVITTSQHWIADKKFHAAILEFTETEANNVKNYNSTLTQHGPFKTPEGNIKTEI